MVRRINPDRIRVLGDRVAVVPVLEETVPLAATAAQQHGGFRVQGGCFADHFAGHNLQSPTRAHVVVVERETQEKREKNGGQAQTTSFLPSVTTKNENPLLYQQTERAALGLRALVYLRPDRMQARHGKSTYAGTASGAESMGTLTPCGPRLLR